MAPGSRRALLLGAFGALAVFVVLFVVVGAEYVVDALLAADPAFVAATIVLGLAWLASWSLMLRTVLETLGVGVTVGKAFLVYAGAVFANNVTPFGQAGGEPFSALLISRSTGAKYETGLAGIATVDVSNVAPSVLLALVGVGYYATTATVGPRLENALTGAIALVAVLGLVLALGWAVRERIEAHVPATIAKVAGRFGGGRLNPVALEREIAGRVAHFFANLRQVGTSRRQLAFIVGLSLLGWLFQAAALLAAFAAVGYSVHVSVVLFAIPLANLAGAAPLPGGLGGIEAAFVLLLVPTTAVPLPEITAAVLIFRGAVYWLPVLIGGSSTAAMGIWTVA
ncbi:YbhN family protein [Saliphagus sp. GCM10025308]